MYIFLCGECFFSHALFCYNNEIKEGDGGSESINLICGNNKFLIFYPIFFYFLRLPTSAKEDRNIGKWNNLLIRDVYKLNQV